MASAAWHSASCLFCIRRRVPHRSIFGSRVHINCLSKNLAITIYRYRALLYCDPHQTSRIFISSIWAHYKKYCGTRLHWIFDIDGKTQTLKRKEHGLTIEQY